MNSNLVLLAKQFGLPSELIKAFERLDPLVNTDSFIFEIDSVYDVAQELDYEQTEKLQHILDNFITYSC